MKRIIIKIAVLAAVFLGSLALFMSIINRQEVLNTKNMAEPTLPLMYMRVSDTTVNRLCGYRQEVSEKSLRDTITPLPSDRKLSIEICPYANEIKGITYQLTSLEDGGIIENGKIKSIYSTDGNMMADFNIENPIRMGQEYMLRFSVDTGSEEPLYYYTRLVQRTGQNLKWYLDYVEAFYQNCLNKNMTDEMRSQLETEMDAKNSSIHCVTLKSAEDQLLWGNLSPVLAKKAVPQIVEINETTVSIKLDYLVSAKDEENNEELYTVTEFYRMRKAQDNVVLLDYERTATQFFGGNLPVLTEDGLNLGVTGKDVEFVVNDKADMAAFVQAGELWLYNRGANKVTRLFSYSDGQHADDRTLNQSYDISVSSVSPDGDTTFIVYGYRTAGNREGTLGISVYRYDNEENTTKELMFIPLQDSYELSKQGLSRLTFVNSKDQCFLYYDNVIYAIHIDEQSVTVMQKDVDWQKVSVSASQMFVAWGAQNESGYSKSITELNLETGGTISIDAPEGDFVNVLGYMGEDIIYGVAHEADCYTDTTGNKVFPMYRVSIRNTNGDLVEDYMVDNVYVTGITIEDDLINMTRLENSEGRMRNAPEDQLIHYAPEKSKGVDVDLNVSQRQGTQVQLVFSSRGESTNLLSLNTRYPANESDDVINIPEMRYSGNYYSVYAKGGLYALYAQINKAIETADGQAGVVLNEKQQYVWERGNIQTVAKLDIAAIPQGLLSAPIEEEAVAQAVPDGYNVWNLSGCSLSSVCYQISSGYAVAGQWSDGETKLIVGYDQYNVWLYDGAGGMYAVALEDAQAAFEACGNIFISYHES